MSDLTDFLLARIAEDEECACPPPFANCPHPPASPRLLAECEARRRYVNQLAPNEGRFLALPYADHPDYREEWKP